MSSLLIKLDADVNLLKGQRGDTSDYSKINDKKISLLFPPQNKNTSLSLTDVFHNSQVQRKKNNSDEKENVKSKENVETKNRSENYDEYINEFKANSNVGIKFTGFENMFECAIYNIGQLLKAGKITKSEAQKRIETIKKWEKTTSRRINGLTYSEAEAIVKEMRAVYGRHPFTWRLVGVREMDDGRYLPVGQCVVDDELLIEHMKALGKHSDVQKFINALDAVAQFKASWEKNKTQESS